MVSLVEQGWADQNDVARAFGCSARSIRRYQRRFEAGGSPLWAEAGGYPRGRDAVGGRVARAAVRTLEGPGRRDPRDRAAAGRHAEGRPEAPEAHWAGRPATPSSWRCCQAGTQTCPLWRSTDRTRPRRPVRRISSRTLLSGCLGRSTGSGRPPRGSTARVSRRARRCRAAVPRGPACAARGGAVRPAGAGGQRRLHHRPRGLRQPRAGVLRPAHHARGAAADGVAAHQAPRGAQGAPARRISAACSASTARPRSRRCGASSRAWPAWDGPPRSAAHSPSAGWRTTGPRSASSTSTATCGSTTASGPLPKTHVARMRLSMPATTDYWVNDATGHPLFVVTAEANAGMVKMLPRVLDEVRVLVGERRVTVVFDRGGYSPKLFLTARERRLRPAHLPQGAEPPRAHARFTRHKAVLDGQAVAYSWRTRRSDCSEARSACDK